MPVKLEWHSSLPVLTAVYSGMLTAKEYQAMCNQRARLLDERSGPVFLLADTQGLEDFEGARDVQITESILKHGKIARTLIVLPRDFYTRLSRALRPDLGQNYYVYFYPDISQALHAVEELSAN